MRRPVLHVREQRRLVWALGVFACLAFLVYRAPLLDPLFAGPAAAVADFTVLLLTQAGFVAASEGNRVILSSGVIYEVSYRCLGILPVSFLAICILVLNGRLSEKLVGVCGGAAVLLGLNQVRIVHLIVLNEASPQAFALMHDVVWGTAPVLGVLLLLVGWRSWAERAADSAPLFSGP
ncbi:MAG: hypothetical protein Tsb0032_15410 [Kiloniellaceae bacterium]